MRPPRSLLAFFAAVLTISTTHAQDLPETLYFVPFCAHGCIATFLPAYISAPFSSCQTWAGNTNPTVAAAETSAEKIRAQIAGCVWDGCGAEANQDAGFQEALAGVCPPARTPSASSSASPSPTPTPTTTPAPVQAVEDVDDMEEKDAQRQGSSSGGGLAPGAIAGIVLGVLIFLTLVAAAVFFFLRRRSQRRETPHQHSETREFVEPKGWHNLSSGNASTSTSTTPSPPPGAPLYQHEQEQEHEPMPPRQSRGFDFAFDVEATAGAHVSPVVSPEQEYVRPMSVRPDENPELWSPVSPVSPVIGAFPFPFPPEVRRQEQEQEQEQQQEEEQGPYGHGIVSMPYLPRNSMLNRSDSVEWRREVEEAAERAATRVGLKVSEPILETTPAPAPAPETRWTRRVSEGVLGKARRASGAGR
ncbi:hypothetical protein BZA05DRAFT_395519 [Tricharina praecox]|uniref:uncharacterized protein n=1 Tax=Tricharina praecox TaxID=43433 RepID=UPI00221FE720|nr:uncharacterized protein BZA05DRAFT_395519 [Tricharina praecox]KAI5854060.1 hypothetical protein BZA05DRAFT_395519 [Tricharina praecox]